MVSTHLKNISQQWIISPGKGESKKYLSCHHLENLSNEKPNICHHSSNFLAPNWVLPWGKTPPMNSMKVDQHFGMILYLPSSPGVKRHAPIYTICIMKITAKVSKKLMVGLDYFPFYHAYFWGVFLLVSSDFPQKKQGPHMRGCVGSGGAAKSLIRTKVNLSDGGHFHRGFPRGVGARRDTSRKNLTYVSILKKSDGE